jgi:hypothetical protein
MTEEKKLADFFFSLLFDGESGASPGVMAIRFRHQPRYRHRGLYHELKCSRGSLNTV